MVCWLLYVCIFLCFSVTMLNSVKYYYGLEWFPSSSSYSYHSNQERKSLCFLTLGPNDAALSKS